MSATHYVAPDGDLLTIPKVQSIWIKEATKGWLFWKRNYFQVCLDTDDGKNGWVWDFPERGKAEEFRDALIAILSRTVSLP